MKAYRNGDYSANKHLDKIEDVGVKELLASMIEKNPTKRKSAEIYLSQARGNIFPEYFYSFLQSYMLMFSAAPILSPDEKIIRLKKDIEYIINILKTEEEERKRTEVEKSEVKIEIKSDDENDDQNSNIVMDNDNDKQLKMDECKLENQRSLKDEESTNTTNEEQQDEDSEKLKDLTKSVDNLEGLVIVTQLVTSCIRGLHHSQSKLQSLEILLELAKNTSDETILDRILPYIVSFYFSFLDKGKNIFFIEEL